MSAGSLPEAVAFTGCHDSLWEVVIMPAVIRAAALAVLFLVMGQARAALVPPYYFSTVVALGSMQVVPSIEPGKPPTIKWVTEGTGFFYGYLVQDDPDIAKKKYAVFLATAGHVVKEHPTNASKTIGVRVDAEDAAGKAQNFEVPIDQWFFHPDSPQIDLAAFPMPIEMLKSLKLESGFFANDLHSFTKSQMSDAGVSAGDGIFVLGFPMGLAGENRNYAIVRQGSIARISEYLDGKTKSFLIDSFVFPGNSGGPVILKPEINSIQGTKSNLKAMLVGVVEGYQPYIDIASSLQTKHQRIAFEENSGLAVIFPVDYVKEMLKEKSEAILKAEQLKLKPPETAPIPEAAPAK
jgi:Trypsin-like peptidase domain